MADGTLRTRVFDDVLLRFCVAPHVDTHQAEEIAKDAVGDAAALQERLRRAWIVGDEYKSAWSMPSLTRGLLAHRGTDAPSRLAFWALLSPSQRTALQTSLD